MSTIQLSPYLNFNGDCREAMEFYQSVLGGKLEFSTFGEADPNTPENLKDRVMHSTLTNDYLSFMASDGAPDGNVVFGDSIHVSIAGDDEALLRKYFEGLSAGGKVTMPLDKQAWGDIFGMLTDKYGIHWMMNIGMGSDKK